MLHAMSVQRMDHVSIIVDDLAAAVAFFTELGLAIEGEMAVEGDWVDRVNGIDGVKVDMTMMKTPDGHSRVELTRFRAPSVIDPGPAPVNTLGLRTIMFAVDDIADVVTRLRAHGGTLVGEIADYQDIYRLCYVRGPAGIIVALAQSLR
jgi:catechol 2,3-dioxygenase-like lactoylglutathione lyase family enzyme